MELNWIYIGCGTVGFLLGFIFGAYETRRIIVGLMTAIEKNNLAEERIAKNKLAYTNMKELQNKTLENLAGKWESN